jgi:hypothetical protein
MAAGFSSGETGTALLELRFERAPKAARAGLIPALPKR